MATRPTHRPRGGRRGGNPPHLTLEAVTVLDPPDWLTDRAAGEWRRLAPLLCEHGLLTEADMVPFARYCQAWARATDAELIIKTLGPITASPHGKIIRRPELQIAKENWLVVDRLSAQFALVRDLDGLLRIPTGKRSRAPQLSTPESEKETAAQAFFGT